MKKYCVCLFLTLLLLPCFAEEILLTVIDNNYGKGRPIYKMVVEVSANNELQRIHFDSYDKMT